LEAHDAQSQSSVLVERGPEPHTEAPPSRPAPRSGSLQHHIQDCLNNHSSALTLAIVATGLAVRLVVASRGFLNPDEALHYLVSDQRSAFLAYKMSSLEAHPPLLYMLLYFSRFLGTSELILRLPSVIAGTLFCWFSFKWMELFFGKSAGQIGLVLLTFSPAIINLSAEVRQYALLLCFMSASLYFLGRAFREKSARYMWYFSASLYLAILSHYSAALFVVAIGIYAVVRIADSQPTRKLIITWIIGQAGALAIYGFLYLTQFMKVRPNIPFWDLPFGQYYFHWQDGDLFYFLRENTASIFLYIFKQPYLSVGVVALFALGVAYLFFRGFRPLHGQTPSFHLAILISLPFVIAWGAAVAKVYPYIGSRHTIYLAPFAVGGASVFIATAVREKLWAGLAIAALIAALANASEDPSLARIKKENQGKALMTGAIHYVRQTIPRSDWIFADQQSQFLLQYYLCGPRQISQLDTAHRDFFPLRCDGYSIVASNLWKLNASNFVSTFQTMAPAQSLKSGDRIWVFQAGWGSNLDVQLPRRLSQFRCLKAASFGQNITVIPFVTGRDLTPSTSTSNCQGAS
jgi:dolichyl-phosphate-mannose-protein mannosyltransferase